MHRSFTSNTLTCLFTARSAVLLRLKYFASRNTGSVNCTAFSDLNEKYGHSVAHHRSREAAAAGTVRVSKEHASTCLGDIFTKTMAASKREEELLCSFTSC
jgi:hypothetical protein